MEKHTGKIISNSEPHFLAIDCPEQKDASGKVVKRGYHISLTCPSAAITLNGKKATIAELRKDDEVVAVGDPATQITATRKA